MSSSEFDPVSLYPVMLDLAGRRCVVVGGGRVACRKVQGLLAVGAKVTLVAPDCLISPADVDEGLEWLQRPWRHGDLKGAVLAFAATDNPEVNRAVAAEAKAAKIPVNVASDGGESDFQLPAVRRQGELVLAVGSTGSSPALSAVVADRLFARLGEEWGVIVRLAAALREGALTGHKPEEYNQSILRLLLDRGLEQLVAEGRRGDIDQLLQQVCGAGCSLKQLGIELPGKRP